MGGTKKSKDTKARHKKRLATRLNEFGRQRKEYLFKLKNHQAKLEKEKFSKEESNEEE